jgi:hypothetical protein
MLATAFLLLSMGLVIWHNAPASQPETVEPAKQPVQPPATLTSRADAKQATSRVRANEIQLCQVLSPADPNPIPAVDCVNNCPPGYEATWNAMGPVPEFQEWGQGEYVGRARLSHVPQYRLRVDDQLQFVFRVTRNELATPYKLNVGDEVTIESTNDRELRRSLVVLPDGTITLPLIGQIRAANMSIAQLRDELEKQYEKYYNLPGITITPTKVDTKLEDLRHGCWPQRFRRPVARRPGHAGRHDPVARRRVGSGAGPDAGRVPLGACPAVCRDHRGH